METIYQPIVIEKANEIIESLDGFFKDYEIESLDFARKYLCDKLTSKFIYSDKPLFFHIEPLFQLLIRISLYQLSSNGLLHQWQQ